jgi:O-antigen/teichoic acid export membrane protein
MSIFKLLVNGGVLRAVSLLINIGIAFLLMPYVIHQLGDRWYGVWVIVGTVIGYYGVMDFGLASASQRFIAKAYAAEKREEINTAISTSFFSFCIIAIVFFLVSCVIAVFASVFFEQINEADIFSIVILIMGAKILVTLPLSCVNGVITSHLRYDFISYVQVIKTITRALLFYYFLSRGYSIVTMAIIAVGIEFTGSIAALYFAKWLDKELKVSVKFCHFERIKEFYHYGKHVFVTNIANLLRFQVDSLVIANFLSLSLVTHYSVAVRLIEYVGQFIGSLFGVFLPVFTRYHSLGEQQQLNEKIHIVMTVSSMFSLLACALLATFGLPFILLWMGNEYSDAFLPLLALALSSAVGLTTLPLSTFLNAIAKHQYYAYVTLIESFFNVGLSIWLVGHYGITGVALGTAIPVIISKLVFIVPYAYRQANLPVWNFYYLFGVRALFTVVYFSSVYWCIAQYYPIESYLDLIVIATLSALGYAVLFILLLMDALTKNYLIAKLPVKFQKKLNAK